MTFGTYNGGINRNVVTDAALETAGTYTTKPSSPASDTTGGNAQFNLVWFLGEDTYWKVESTKPIAGYFAGDPGAEDGATYFPAVDGKTAQDADTFLQSRGLILRAVGAYGLSDCLRMTVGLADENRAVVAALKEFLGR